MPDTHDYLLGHAPAEWDRLREQHALWGPVLMEDLRSAGLGSRARVLEVGCGAGDLLEDLVALTGRAEGLELDPAAAAHAAQRLGVPVRALDLMQDDLAGPWDAVVARWVLSFLPDTDLAVARMAESLAPDGLLAVHDYDHDGLGVWPKHPAIVRVIEAFRQAYRDRGGDLWVAAKLPAAFRRAGLVDIEVLPHAKAGPPGSPVWRWVERFLIAHVPTIEASGHLSGDEVRAFRDAWAERAADGDAVLFSPLQVTVLGVRR